MSAPMITLLTDFGRSDSYAGQMQAVIATVSPAARIIDLTHDIGPQNIVQAACVLADSVAACPPGTIHVVVVDPGVGSQRRAIAAEIGPWLFVAPDNGVLTAVQERWPLGRIVELTKPEYHRPGVSATFHGRDLFGPVAAHLANGVEIDHVGRELATPPVRVPLPKPLISDTQVSGEVLWSDHYGNLITNIREVELPNPTDFVRIGEQSARFVTCYAEGQPGELVALIGSSGRLEIASRDGSAAQVLSASPGSTVVISRNISQT